MDLPLAKRMKKQAHKDIATAQDMIVETLLEHVPQAVFHGGTCIWRCHAGDRFSEDLDFYLGQATLEGLFEALSKQGFRVQKKKISSRSLYSTLVHERTTVRLEGTFQESQSALLDYERVDGRIMVVAGLTKEQLLREKAHAYLKRRKVRDLYDVFFLLRYVDARDVAGELGRLLEGYEKPEDEGDLRTIILQGLVPSAEKMHEYIKRKCHDTSSE